MRASSIRRTLATAAALCSTVVAAADVDPGTLSTWACTGSCGQMAAAGDIAASPLAGAGYGFVTTSGSDAFGVSPLALDPNSRGSGAETNGSKFVSGAFSAQSGDALNIHFNYVSTDGKGFDDYAWARLVDAGDGRLVAWLFTARSSNSGTKNIVPGDVVDKRAFDPDATIVNYKDYDFTSKTADDPVDWAPLGFSNQSCWKDNAAGCGYTGWLQSSYSFVAGGSYRLEVGVVNWGDGAYDSGLAFDFAGAVTSVPEPAPGPLLLAGMAAMAFVARRRRR